MTVTSVIIDDEKLGRDLIRRYLSLFPQINNAGECSNGFEGIKLIQELSPDLVFLDIQMPKISGFEMLELIENPPVIIFTTAYDEYAIKAFEVSAADYLLKPFSEERFCSAVEKALRLINEKKNNTTAVRDFVGTEAPVQGYLQRVVVKQSGNISVIPVSSILQIEAQDDYVMLYTAEGKFLKQKTMNYFEKNLDPAEFVRIHRSHIIRITALRKIVLMEKESYKAVMNDNTHLPLSRSGYNKLKEILK